MSIWLWTVDNLPISGIAILPEDREHNINIDNLIINIIKKLDVGSDNLNMAIF